MHWRTLSWGLVLTVLTSSHSSACVLFCVDQPRAERTLFVLIAASALENFVLGASTHSTSTVVHLYCSVLISLGAERTLSGLIAASALGNFVLGASAHSTY